MRTVGSVLREERLKQGLTLESVSVETKLPLRSLSAIESDDLGTFSSPFFYKSFVKQYATRMKVDYGVIGPLVEARAGEMPTPTLPGEREQLPNVPAIDPPPSNTNHRWVFPSAALIAVLVGCSAVYAWLEDQHGPRGTGARNIATVQASSRVSANATSAAPTASVAAPNNKVADPLVKNPATESAAPVDEPVATPKTETPTFQEGGPSASVVDVQLKLSALERVWVSVVADGKNIFSGVLETNETKAFESHETAKVKIGNAANLQVVFNGRVIGALGVRGQVLTAVFTPQSYEILSRPEDQATSPHVELSKYPIGE